MTDQIQVGDIMLMITRDHEDYKPSMVTWCQIHTKTEKCIFLYCIKYYRKTDGWTIVSCPVSPLEVLADGDPWRFVIDTPCAYYEPFKPSPPFKCVSWRHTTFVCFPLVSTIQPVITEMKPPRHVSSYVTKDVRVIHVEHDTYIPSFVHIFPGIDT
jgi:hypothetical protein